MTGSQIAKGESLIKLTGIKKVFYTDEVETHALEDVHLDIKKGEYIAISGAALGRSAAARGRRARRGR